MTNPYLLAPTAFTSTDSASGRSSQNSVRLSDSSSSEDVEECELKGTKWGHAVPSLCVTIPF